MSELALRNAFFSVAHELYEKLSKSEWDEFYSIFLEKAKIARTKNPTGMQLIEK
ncbi:MAG: hypothetical protein ACOX1L_03365 [Erysipelotrichaceae bacterium]|jgi:hypothetical protein